MKLTQAQLAEYDDKGFIIFPSLMSRAETDRLRDEMLRVAKISARGVSRDPTSTVQSIFRVHDRRSPTGSSVAGALGRLPRIMEPVQQVLRDDAIYVYQSRCAIKNAVDGAVWQWHRDYGTWERDGVPTPTMATSMVMIDEAAEMAGCLYMIPGTHKAKPADTILDASDHYNIWTVPKHRVIGLMEDHGDPVAITGAAGTVVLFHCNIVYSAGHNMSRLPRQMLYTVYNTVANCPRPIANPRPDWLVSPTCLKLALGNDGDILGRRAA